MTVAVRQFCWEPAHGVAPPGRRFSAGHRVA